MARGPVPAPRHFGGLAALSAPWDEADMDRDAALEGRAFMPAFIVEYRDCGGESWLFRAR
jgi:hypothetical protein